MRKFLVTISHFPQRIAKWFSRRSGDEKGRKQKDAKVNEGLVVSPAKEFDGVRLTQINWSMLRDMFLIGCLYLFGYSFLVSIFLVGFLSVILLLKELWLLLHLLFHQ